MQISGAVFFSFYLILNSYVPLDLAIIIELSKLFYTIFMELDVGMKTIAGGFKAQTLNLHEDLAEVDYVFSDKTGTLTKNELVFRE